MIGYWNFDEALDDQRVLDQSSLGWQGTLGGSSSPESADPMRVVSSAPIGVPVPSAAALGLAVVGVAVVPRLRRA